MHEDSIFTIKYRRQFIATPKTRIHFFGGDPSLTEIFLECSPNERRLFVTDTNVARLESVSDFLKNFGFEASMISEDKNCAVFSGQGEFKDDALIVIPAGEAFKTIESVLAIVRAALDRAFGRKDIFVGIGGGVVTDMTAFAAALYKRGARCELVPTTLLSMVDAALGGKSGCDFDDYKNMIGAFFPAENLFVFPQFVQSLSDDEYRSGFAEAFKQALLFDKKLFAEISAQKEKVKLREKDFVFKMISKSVEAKARVVQKDMTEKNERMLLNLGHTFAHALETCAGLGKISHGDAVGWGIGRALCVSCNLGLCSEEYKNQVLDLIEFFGWERNAKHKVFSCEKSAEKLLDAMRRDKKNSSKKIRLILQRGLCENLIREISDEEILKCL
ncbi:MAG: 3-dehydroquinate synthase [Treponema sp.]|nr:3-dehydroquinate synthase [Treponema sp.]